jgi:hypothetical protein
VYKAAREPRFPKDESLLSTTCDEAHDVDDGDRRTIRVGLVFATPSIAEGTT